MPLVPGFEWFVAWRHLRDPERRSRRMLIAGLAALALGALCLGAVHLAPHLPFLHLRHGGLDGGLETEWMPSRAAMVLETLKTGAFVVLGLGLILTLLGVLFASFTVFTAISIFGVFLGTGAPIVALSVMSGFEADLKGKIRATKADVVVSTDESGDVPRPFTDWQAVQAKLADIPGVVASMAYVEAEVIVKHATNPAGMGIILRGIDPTRASKVLDLGKTLVEGKVEYLEHPAEIPREEAEILRPVPSHGDEGGGEHEKVGADSGEARARRQEGVLPGILLGEELYAHTLRVFLGSDVDVACPLCGVGPAGPMPKMRPFRVAGHFYTGMYEFDSKLAYVSLAEAQRFLGMQGEVTGIEVRTKTPEMAREVADEIASRVGPGYEVRSWEELNKGLFTALKLEKIAMFVVLTFIALVASFSIVSNLIMMVTEKAREVAILKSMGARDGAILRVFIAEGLYIGLLGLALGLVFGIGSCILLSRYGLPLDPDVYYIQKLPVVMRAAEIASVSFAALGLCCLATLYPAYLASRMRPVEGLRYE